jgi:hypothetical protein
MIDVMDVGINYKNNSATRKAKAAAAYAFLLTEHPVFASFFAWQRAKGAFDSLAGGTPRRSSSRDSARFHAPVQQSRAQVGSGGYTAGPTKKPRTMAGLFRIDVAGVTCRRP